MGIKKELVLLAEPFMQKSLRPAIYGFVAIVLMLVYFFQGHRGFFAVHLAPLWLSGADAAQIEWWGTLYQFASAFLLFLVMPAVLLKFAAKEKLTDLGLGLGNIKYGSWVVVLGVILLAVPAGLTSGGMPGFAQEYPMAKISVVSFERFIVYQLCYGLLYYAAWESFFRGFLQFGLSKHIGDIGAILVQTSASTLLHIGKPINEVWAALLAGLLFGAVVLRTRSVWPLVVVHWVLGILTDLSSAHSSGIWP